MATIPKTPGSRLTEIICSVEEHSLPSQVVTMQVIVLIALLLVLLDRRLQFIGDTDAAYRQAALLSLNTQLTREMTYIRLWPFTSFSRSPFY